MSMSKRNSPKASPLVAVAYIRASKEEQRLSEPAQRAAILAWASGAGVTVASWHVDQGVCSVDDLADRPALMAALAALKSHGAGVLVVAKRDRLARDVVLAAQFSRTVTKAGADVVSAAGEGNGAGPAAEFMRTVIDGAAQYERALIRARTSSALQAKRARDERVSARLPYGFALAADGTHHVKAGQRTCGDSCPGCLHLAPVESEQRVIARARELRDGRSLQGVADALTAEGFASRTGRPFAAMQVSRMIDTEATAAA
jgi:DNA invertase Pin-like site-specific DNA recombinase